MRRKVTLKLGVWLLILAAVVIALAACAPAQQLPATGANRVEVQEEEFTISMPTSIPAGQTVFDVTNVGTEEHSFVVEGQGIQAELEHHLQPGETMSLEVDLPQGTYLVYCPVEDHAEEGMRLDLTVTAP
jgi:uncharacterized cupredoxin-like copper-binding protein